MLEEQRNQTHAKQVPPPGQRGYPDVYINGPDVDAVTITIDPYKNNHWIRDDSHAGRSQAYKHKGALKDHEGVMKVAHLLDRHAPPQNTFVPTTAQIDGLHKFSTRCIANSTRGRRGAPASANYADLPILTQRLYDWKWERPVKWDWQIEQEMYLANHLDRNRAFDYGGSRNQLR